ncbi:D-alanyl-lipoteichoic acid biosynthesis protein DltD [Clostridium sardiniense]|uniref:D-alanyl-lipoteichoic acid biosynthesis protein DltD n=1 Tax=Clostridium sardiniense TaxID=29369 RepID=UPI00195A3CD5|nr:D-alanyl-lipoteichoic acid biosynthesis protein DltD [Clostridium sardiniense]MBM7833015.1 D-alanine transfer protein [Clostridium sardiniense]
MKKLLYFIIPVFIGVVFAFGLNEFLNKEINDLFKSKNLIPLKNEYASNIKDKGVLLNNELLTQDDIMMLGSSELAHTIKDQHPTNYFNTNRSRSNLFTVGRPYDQNLQQTITLGSTDPNIKNKKVVMLVSMQAFLGKYGIMPEDFQTLFSPNQFYEFLDNPMISEKNKYIMAKRVHNLLQKNEDYASEMMYAKLYNNESFLGRIKRIVLYPYFELRKNMVKLKEKGELYLKLKKLPNKTPEDNKIGQPINWNKEEEQAIREAKKRTKGNKYKVDYSYYEFMLKELPKMKNAYSRIDLLKSTELDDYKQFLNLCSDLKIKPTIVMLTNAKWYYDYTGLTEEKRFKLYNTVEKLAEEKGFKVINLKDKETTDYYLRDIMHLGTKGWVDVSEKIYKEYNQEQIFNK